MVPTSPRDRLYAELQRPAAQVDVARAALYLAQEEYAELAIETYLDRLDQMAADLQPHLPDSGYPLKMIQAINHYLFEKLGFAGNTAAYYDPRNSFLNDVLDRRLGIPITLSVVYLELARRVGFPMAGVGLPGHFLIRPTLEDMAIFVDPFHQGDILFAEDCQLRINQIYGEAAHLSPHHLENLAPREVLTRMLMNLKLVYLRQRDVPRALGAIERVLMLHPEAVGERRDRGLLHYQQGQLDLAQRDLQRYLIERPEASDAYEIRRVLAQIERMQEG